MDRGTISGDLTLDNTDSYKFTATWTQADIDNNENGKLVLTANQSISAKTNIVFTFTIAEPMAAQKKIVPSISITNNQEEPSVYNLSVRNMTTDGVFG